LPPVTRRGFLLGAGLISAGAIAVAGDSVVIEPYHLELVTVEFELPRLSRAFDGFRIAQLSDFHCHDSLSHIPIRKAVEMVNRASPDLVVLCGDYVTDSLLADYTHDEKQSAKQAEPCAQLLGALRSNLGSLAILGNHDVATDPQFVTAALQAHGIPVLRNSSRVIEREGSRLWFCGLDSWDGKPNIDVAMAGVPKNACVVMLMHEPDYADKVAKHPVDLQLSGHSHGGQIWLPGIGAPWLPFGAHKYPRGSYQIGQLQLHTNIGLGTIRLPIRLNCTPEVTLVTLRAPRTPKA